MCQWLEKPTFLSVKKVLCEAGSLNTSKNGAIIFLNGYTVCTAGNFDGRKF